MKVQTREFGEIEIPEENIILFNEGIPGFEEEKSFAILLNEDKDNPFHWLQSLDTPDLAFIITDPFKIYEDYGVVLPQGAIEKLKIKSEEDVIIYTIVVVPDEIEKMTTNLLGPVVINVKEKLGKQVILESSDYTTKHYVFKQDSPGEVK
ncbi:MAG: flagellar assembly protein FliW [Tissierellaceae bacterium]|nr:flagellar assembly protein FliW [Tissierellaceae bacterium]